MRMKSADRWHCTSPACACEILVQTTGAVEGINPRCSCGAPMKKKYASPALTYLEFLRLNESRAAIASKD
jgi:hypothetical protein